VKIQSLLSVSNGSFSARGELEHRDSLRILMLILSAKMESKTMTALPHVISCSDVAHFTYRATSKLMTDDCRLFLKQESESGESTFHDFPPSQDTLQTNNILKRSSKDCHDEQYWNDLTMTNRDRMRA